MKNIIAHVSHVFILIAIVQGLTAQSDTSQIKNLAFYSGRISIENIRGEIIINKENRPELNFVVDLAGKISDNEEVSIGFRGGKASLTREQRLKIEPVYSITGEKDPTKSIKVDLVPLINGQVPDKQIGSSQIKVVLPEDYTFIRANKPFEVSREGVNTILLYKEARKYLTPLLIVFNTNGMGLSIEKTVVTGSIKKGNVTFILDITNTGTKPLDEILLEDNLDPRDFSAQGEEFTLYQGEINDQRLLWKRKIPSLSPGEKLKIEYTVQASHDINAVSLDAAKATVNGVLVGVSNKLKLASKQR